ncbi:MATE family efflux transporter [Candidatus Agathobaculum pullicola]|uniref:MATE family efflux transporter n=1 Tax=Candidatus Agathobaculum pullicola TaxID=2838426 RepID=UPI003F92E748
MKKLIWPLVLEQVLSITVGLADTIMVSSVGEAAVSGVSLVDMLNVLIINIFAALATGGAVVVAQLLGARQNRRACNAARQLYFVVICISVALSALVMLIRTPLLRLLFGSIEPDVMDSALTYLTVSVFSYPVLAIYNAGAALFRAQGNSRISMLIAGLINIVNLIGNSILIFGLRLGVAGAALSSVFSRGVAAVVITVLLLHPEHIVSLRRGGHFRPDNALIRRILQIGIPNGLENSLFQLGRILVVSMIALFGTTQIAANAVANNLDAVACIPGQAMNLAIITVVGQCIGAGDIEQARRMAKKLLKITYLIFAICCLATILATPLVLKIYSLSPEALALGKTLIFIHNFSAMVFWPLSFTMPNVLRAANDVRYPMVCSIASMMLLRLGSGYVLAVMFQMGAIGIWIAMVGDWLCRGILFTLRFASGRWLRFAPGLQLVAQGEKS